MLGLVMGLPVGRRLLLGLPSGCSTSATRVNPQLGMGACINIEYEGKLASWRGAGCASRSVGHAVFCEVAWLLIEACTGQAAAVKM